MKWLFKINSQKSNSFSNEIKVIVTQNNLKQVVLKERKNNFSIEFFVFVFSLILQIKQNLSYQRLESLKYYSKEITLKIIGKGNQTILGHYYNLCPKEVYLNGALININDDCKNIYIDENEENENNTIKLVWNDIDNNINSMQGIFSRLSNIIEIDFSNYDSSSIIYMGDMLYNCSNLISVNFSNFNTSNVEDMSLMFYGCSSLTELNLANFNTSKVTNMSSLFYSCVNLKSLEISSFITSQVIDMSFMFYQLNSLENLELSNFETSKVEDMSYMFYQCETLTSLDLKGFVTSSAHDMAEMFYECINIKSLNLTNFNTSQVYFMENMFRGCSNLIHLDVSSFITSNVVTMNYMFYGCKSLLSLEISNFDTSNVYDMEWMFAECSSLISLNLSSFNTGQVEDMKDMFYGCNNLTILDVSSFNTNSLLYSHYMFADCFSLTSLDLSNFYTPKLEIMMGMFDSCISLTYLDISNFSTENIKTMVDLFYNCRSLLSLNLSSFITNQVENMRGMFEDCLKLKYLDLTNFNTSLVTNMGKMFKSCENLENLIINNFNTQSVTDMEEMFTNCASLTSLDLSSFDTSYVAQMSYMFSGCENLKELNLSNFNFSSMTSIKGIFSNCKNLEYINFMNYEDIENLVINNSFDHVPENIVICVNENNQIDNLKEIINSKLCPTIYCSDDWKAHQKKIVWENKTCVANCTNFKYKNNNMCYSTCPEGADFCKPETTYVINNNILTTNKEENIETELNLGENNEEIYHTVVKDKVQNYEVSKGEEIFVEAKKDFFYHITTSENEKDFTSVKNKTNQFSKIDLGECENILKEHYNINKTVSLIIMKFEKKTNVSTERSLQYEVYDPFNKTKLNLSICDNTTIDIYVPIELSNELQNLYNELQNQGYDLFDEKSDFYQDICTPFKSPNGTDVLLSDRYNYYFNNNETLCQSNCKFSEYSMETQYLKCECDTSNSQINTDEESVQKFKPKIIYESFYDILKFSNYKVLKCAKLSFNLNNVMKNKGSIIAIIYFTLYLLVFIIYCVKGINQLKLDLAKKILNRPRKSNNDLENDNNIEITKKIDKILSSSGDIQKNNEDVQIMNKTSHNHSLKKSKIHHTCNFPPKKKSSLSSKKKSLKHKNSKVQILENKSNDKKRLMSHKLSSSFKISEINNENINKEKILFNSEIIQVTQEEKMDNFELNNLEYDLALKLDKREFLEIYWSILKREHMIFFTFFVRDDYNIVYIKFSRFIFLVCTDMALNVFFFSDETMHKMFLDYGKYNFIQQIPQIIYSTIVSQLIEVFLCFLSLTDKHFYEIKNLSNSSKYMMFKIIKYIKIKVAIFYIFTFIMFIFYWYAITCFCSVYENTQIAFIKDSISSFALGLLYPFVLYLMPASLRIIALRASKIRCSFLYSLSDIIPIF